MIISKRILMTLTLIGFLVSPAVRAEEVSYKYDEQGRLITAYYENGKTIKYSYDAAGNRYEDKIILNGVIPGTESNPTYDLVVLPIIGFYSMPFNLGSGAYGGPSYAETTGFVADLTYSAGTPLNLRTLANSNGYTGGHATMTVTVTNDVLGDSGGGTAIQTGDWPDEAAIKLTLKINSGVKIYGGGGNGGNGGFSNGGYNGGSGGSAIVMSEGLIIENEGVIKGGSGGGGGGGGYQGDPDASPPESEDTGGGGGGGGFPNGLGGAGAGSGLYGGSDGGTGSVSGGGGGGAGAVLSGNGGAGGGSSVASGGGGTQGDYWQGQYYAGGVGGAAGWGIVTNAHSLVYSGAGSYSSMK